MGRTIAIRGERSTSLFHMPIYETFSGRRDQAAKAGAAEIYAYDVLPPTLINQIVMIWEDVLPGHRNRRHDLRRRRRMGHIEKVILREHGLPFLQKRSDWDDALGVDDLAREPFPSDEGE